MKQPTPAPPPIREVPIFDEWESHELDTSDTPEDGDFFHENDQ